MKWILRLLATGRFPLVLLLLILFLTLLGPFLSPFSPTEVAGPPVTGPSPSNLLGTDMLGRDVLSRIMHGGVLLLVMASASTVLTYLIAIPLGMIASVNKGFIDGVLMRGIDVLIALPALLVLLVVLTAAGSSLPVLIIGTAIVRIPLATRVSRTATSAVFASEFVEAAIARGERLWSVLFREVLPNIKEEVFSTVGLSFTAAVLLMASLNFLGVGLQPPSPDWGIMISENRSIFGLNPFSVLAPTFLLALLTISITGTWDAFRKRGPGKKRTRASQPQSEVTS
jgi:ABC-type dipeptide/oligopeptide/nickel transport system permease subunit